VAGLADFVTVSWAPTSGPLSTTPTWTDVTTKVQSVTINSGRSGAFSQYEPVSCSVVLDNRAGTVNPTLWYRWRQVKVEVSTGGGTTTLFRGFVQTVEHDQGEAPKNATATLYAEDVLAILSRREIAYGVPYGDSAVPQETADERISRILTASDIPAGWVGTIGSTETLLSAPTAPVNEVETTGVLVGNALQLIEDCAEADLGAIYTRAGLVTYDDRYSLVDRARTPGTYPTFSDTPTGSQVSYLRGALTLTPPGTDYRNLVSYTGTSGNAQRATYPVANYPYDSLSRTLPLAVDQQALGNAQGLLEVYRQQKVWPLSLSVHLWPNKDANLLALAGLNVRDYAEVLFTPVGQTQKTYKCFVSGLVHTLVPGRWTTDLVFESADRWYDAWVAPGAFLELNSATVGQLNQELLGY
jgi:hypothetical protein